MRDHAGVTMESVSTQPIFMLKLVALLFHVRDIWVQISAMRATVLTRFLRLFRLSK